MSSYGEYWLIPLMHYAVIPHQLIYAFPSTPNTRSSQSAHESLWDASSIYSSTHDGIMHLLMMGSCIYS